MLFFANILGFIGAKWKTIATIIGIAMLVLFVALAFNRCKKEPKLDIKNIEKINSANEKERLEELSKTVEQNADVVKTVDGRNAISEQDEASKQAAIWAKVKEADEKIQAAKSQGRDVTSEELECLLIPENCK